MAALKPHWPTRADHRYILKLLSIMGIADKIELRQSEFARVSRVFSKAGGSWQAVFGGSAEATNLLKKVIKVAVKHGYLTKKEALK